tara:strand:- start:810 stop:1097 length:288 start_codon:yes stop_codon:yes gene_type:complete
VEKYVVDTATILRKRRVVKKLTIAPIIAKIQVVKSCWEPILGSVEARKPPMVPAIKGISLETTIRRLWGLRLVTLNRCLTYSRGHCAGDHHVSSG